MPTSDTTADTRADGRAEHGGRGDHPAERSATFALYATASFHGEVVEESFVRTGEPLQLGNSPALAVPVPRGLEYIARITWAGPARCEVRDGRGAVHALTPAEDLTITVGAVSLRLSLVEQFRLKRATPPSVSGSLAFLAVFLLSSLIVAQAAFLVERRCWVEPLIPFYYDPACHQDPSGVAGSAYTAEYLARLLRDDLDGEDVGMIEHLDEIERPEAERETKDVFMPAGNEGPVSKMGGADETAPEPIRTDAEEIPIREKKVEEKQPLFVEEAPTEIEVVEEPTEAEDGVDDGIEAPDQEDPPDIEPPAEEEEGWGIPDWYDEKDRELEEMEIEVMLELARRRLRIDPNDPTALSVLSYYQYLAGDYDAALDTYDRFIELYPESAAGYNNKALVYKRRGDYEKEEGLYRTALYYQPNDVTALNNLAVNLSHQGRFEEALAIMQELEVLDPDDPYADLHRAKIHAEIGNEDQALSYLRKALTGMAELDTLHHIEFRQDIRLDPSFAELRSTERFRSILHEFYGEASPLEE